MFGSITSQGGGGMVAGVWVTAGPIRAEDKPAKVDPKTAQAAEQTKAVAGNGNGHECWWPAPAVRPAAPPAKNEAWLSYPIDSFILNPLEKAALSPTPGRARRN